VKVRSFLPEQLKNVLSLFINQKIKTMKKVVEISEKILWIYYIIAVTFVVVTTTIW
jgi:hypothetical protein